MPGNIGDFKDLIEGNKEHGLFVDKTLFIQEIIESKTDPLLITRPRRWGKTLNLNMLFYYFAHRDQIRAMGRNEEYIKQCNELFEQLHIFNETVNVCAKDAKEHFGRYPVLLISFSVSGDDANKDDIREPNWDKIKRLIVSRIGSLFSELGYLEENLEEKAKEQFRHILKENIVIAKQAFETEDLSNDIRSGIYKKSEIAHATCPAQQDLDKFIRLRYGKPEDDAELSGSINFLAQLLHRFHGHPVYLLIDEYDSLINRYFNEKDILKKLTLTFSGIFSAFAKPNGMMNPHIQKVIFTGILRVAKANIFSGLNNLKECTVLDAPFSKYYGFTQEELLELLEKSGKKSQAEEVMEWYNGYRIGKEVIYNPWSVMQFIQQGVLQPYWMQTANSQMIQDIVLNNKGHAINKTLRDIIKNNQQNNRRTVQVVVNKYISVEDLEDPDNIWSFLVHTGYLTIDAIEFTKTIGNFICDVRIPNTEISSIYLSTIYDWMRRNAYMRGMLVNLLTEEYEEFADNLHALLNNRYDSALFAREEDSVEEVYHSVLLTELNQETLGEHYALLPEQYTGNGRADILFVDHKNKMVIPIELKRTVNINQLERNAETAVKQVLDKRYGDDPNYQAYEKRPAIGISVCGTRIALKIEGVADLILRTEGVSKK